MHEFLMQIMPNVLEESTTLVESIYETTLMLLISGSLSLLFGLFFGVLLVVTSPKGILPNKFVYIILGKLIDLFRAIPFMILIFFLKDVTVWLSGTSIGLKGTFFPLIVGTTPFFARQIEQAICELDWGLVEASQAMGLSPIEIIFKVYLRESIPSILRASTITLISLLGLTAIVGAIGGGGIGAFCYNYGYSQSHFDITIVSVIIMVIMTILIQTLGNWLVRKTTH